MSSDYYLYKIRACTPNGILQLTTYVSLEQRIFLGIAPECQTHSQCWPSIS